MTRHAFRVLLIALLFAFACFLATQVFALPITVDSLSITETIASDESSSMRDQKANTVIPFTQTLAASLDKSSSEAVIKRTGDNNSDGVIDPLFRWDSADTLEGVRIFYTSSTSAKSPET